MYDVCIVGAGQSGLTTIKTFSDQNIICLEKSCSNGMFQNIKEKNYFQWSSSKYISAFSDFPMTELPGWFTIEDYINYLKSYAKHFNLEKFIFFLSRSLFPKSKVKTRNRLSELNFLMCSKTWNSLVY